MKKFSKNMLAHLNANNKKESKEVEQKISKRDKIELEKYGVTF